MSQNLLKELIALSNDIKTQEELNEKNISDFFRIMELIIKDVIGLNESLWIDREIPDQLSIKIFGWDKINSEWHIVVGQKETYNIPDSDEVEVYGDLAKAISECPKSIQKQVFDESELLISTIHHTLLERLNSLKITGQDIIKKIAKMEEILGGSSPTENKQKQVSHGVMCERLPDDKD